MKLSALVFTVSALSALAACGKAKPVASASATASGSATASAADEPAFKIAEDQRKALESAKEVQKNAQNAIDARQKELEEATSTK